MDKLEVTQALQLHVPEFRRVYITLVGCGGTGSHVASGLVAIAQALDEKGIKSDILFVDPDTVEPKNVGRQLFSAADVGRPKAVVLAERLNAAFASRVGAAVREIDALDTFVPGWEDQAGLSVVVGAVDNAAARKMIAAQVNDAKGKLWWIDAGNENASGQVALGNRAKIKREMLDRQALGLGIVDWLPAPSAVWPDLVKGRGGRKARPARSCAELAAEGSQGLMVNRMAAAWACSLLHDLLLGQVRYFAVAFNLAHGTTRSWALDWPTLESVAEK